MPLCQLLWGWQKVFVFLCHSEEVLDLCVLYMCVHACLCLHGHAPMRAHVHMSVLYVLPPTSLRWRVQRWWTSEMRCYISPCWWRSFLPRCCSRGQRKKRRWCSWACVGKWRAASEGTPAGRERAIHKHKHSLDAPEMRRPQMWRQRSGRNGGKSHCLLTRFRSHFGPSTERQSQTSWLLFRHGITRETKGRGGKFIEEQKHV